MPALPSVPGVMRFDYLWAYGEDLVARTRYFINYTGTAPTNTELNTLADAVMTDAVTNLKGLYGVDTTLEGVEITDLSSSTAATGVSSHAVITGNRSGAVLPADIALLESLQVHRRFRGGHARIYWPFGTQTDMVDPQTWTGAFTAAATTDIANHLGVVIAANWSGGTMVGRVNVSYYEGFTVVTGSTGRARNVSTPRVSPIVDVIISHIVRVGIATIRKRLLGLA
jgi:hypothetical protein